MPPPSDLLLWLRVRLCVGLSVSDSSANAFFDKHGAEEEEAWKAMQAATEDAAAASSTSASSAGDGGGSTQQIAVYYTAAVDGDGGDCAVRRVAGDRMAYAAGEEVLPVTFMVFHPAPFPVEEEPAEMRDVSAPPPTYAQRMDARYAWAVLTSRPPPPPQQLSHHSSSAAAAAAAAASCSVLQLPEEDDGRSDDVVLQGWGIEIALALAKEARRDTGPDAMGEVVFWTERLAVLERFRARLREDAVRKIAGSGDGGAGGGGDGDAAGQSKRWPVLQAQLLSAYIEAARKACDISLVSKPLTTIANTLPAKSGIDSLWDAAMPFHVAFCVIARCARTQFTAADMERIYLKVNAELLEKLVEYVDLQSLFLLTEDEANPPSGPPISGSRAQHACGVEFHTTETVVPLCVASGRVKLEKAKDLLLEWRRWYERCCGWMRGVVCWPTDARRLFVAHEAACRRCDDLLRILEDLVDEQPSVAEDRGGHRRYQALVQMLQGISFDVFDVGHQANWKTVLKRWAEAVNDKINRPDTAPPPLLRRVETEPLGSRLPVDSVLADFSPTQTLPKNCCLVDASTLTELQRINLLEQEKQILAEQLANANALLTEDRRAIVALTQEHGRSQALVESLRAELREAKRESRENAAAASAASAEAAAAATAAV